MTGVQTLNVPVPGAILTVEACGEGWPVVLVHGFAGDRRLWDEAFPALARRGLAVRYDLRGFGESIDGERRPFRHADDLERVLDALGLAGCDLVGVSMGGGVALNFALDHPERVRRLVLVSPQITAWEWSEDWRAGLAPILAAAQAGDLGEARRLWIGHALFATTREIPAAAERLRASTEAYSGAHWTLGDVEEPRLPDLDRLMDLRAPTLLLSGARDLDEFRLMADLIAAAAPQVRRVDVPDAGHMLHLERPQAFMSELGAFLQLEAALTEP